MRSMTASTCLLVVLLASSARAEGDDVLARAAELRNAGEHGQALEILGAALESKPGDAAILLEIGRTHQHQAEEVLRGSSPALGRLSLLDAGKAYRAAIAARPDWAEAHRALGGLAILSADHALAASCYGKAAELEPEDGETRYQLGYALAYLRRFREAVDAFTAAERLLGAQSRILLNLGISLHGIPDPERAKACFLRLLDLEIAAGRKGSEHARSGVLWLWRVYAHDGRYDEAEKVFAALARKHPDLSAAHWYLGYARWQGGRAALAADAFRVVVALTPAFAEGRRMLTLALTSSGRADEAVAALRGYLKIASRERTALPLVFTVAAGVADASGADAAVDLLTSLEETFPDDCHLVEKKADLLVAAKRLGEAAGAYRRAAELNPFSTDPAVKGQKLVTLLLRRGERPEGLAELRPQVEPEEPGEGGVLYDFEEPHVFCRVHGAARGAFDDGAFQIERTGDVGRNAGMTLTFIPTLDTRAFTGVRCVVRGLTGETFRLMAKDAYDEFGPRFVRLTHAMPGVFTGHPKQTVLFPLSGFEITGRREMPLERARLRALVFEIGVPGAEKDKPAAEIRIEEVALVGESGRERVLATFDGPEDETLFLSGGQAGAFAPTLFTLEEAKAARADANTYVRPEILGDEFDEAFVHAGRGSFRLTARASGRAFGELTLGAARAETAEEATAIVFWARGARGGEKVRVVLRDALDTSLGITHLASAPRLNVSGALIEGRFVLGKEWRKFRIPRSQFPDVAFGKLRSLEFEIGTTEGNPAGTAVFLDDIGWE
jgi:tetratricopeptide (TPR) repeat protein